MTSGRFLRGAWIVLLLAPVACEPGADPVVQRPGEPDVVLLGGEDEEMNRAMAEARETIGEFIERLARAPEEQTTLSLKVRFEEGEIIEHIWIEPSAHENGLFAGIVANEPLDLVEIELGEPVRVPLDRVSDWLAVENGRLVGGYTLRVLRDRMSAEERDAFDRETGLIIE